MRVLPCLLLGLVLGGLDADPADAAERKTTTCASPLSPEERRAVIAARKAVPLGRAMRVVKAKIPGDVVNARLCRNDKGLVYVLTVLARNGKVTQARVDAADGQWLGGS
jgi:uncharacterized membrane protein YkoI